MSVNLKPPFDPDRYSILGEIPLWVAIVGTILTVAIMTLLYNPYA